MKKINLILGFMTILTINSHSQTVTDIDGNIYQTIKIGNQLWMKENLKTIHYRNGDSISNKWGSIQGWINYGAYVNYNNSEANAVIYGRLYNWYAVNDSNNICPNNWHVPTLYEWNVLIDYLGGDSIAGGKMKEIGINHWTTPNTGATNESGFTALPAGSCSSQGGFYTLFQYANWWSSTEDISNKAWSINIKYTESILHKIAYGYTIGQSVRCIHDSTTSINNLNDKFDIKIYPNPASDKIYISCSNRLNLKVQAYNTLGQNVLHRELNNLTNSIDIGFLTKGIYILKITSPNRKIEKKIIKE